MNQAPKKLFYLVSQYPAISHTFILREIRVLREAGFRINTASINAADRPVEAMTAEEQEEARGTYYVKAAGWRGALGAHWEALREDPKRYCTSLFYALSLGGLDLHAILYGFFYFVEAILVGRRMRETQDHHLHVHFSGAAATVGLIVQHHYGHGFSIMVHGPDEFYDAPGNLLEKKYAAASFILTISQYARSQVMRFLPPDQWAKVDVTPLGVDPKHFAPTPFRENPSPFTLLCVGRLCPAKGQYILLEVLQRLKEGGRDVMLRFVGDGPDRQTLQDGVWSKRLVDNVVLEGAVGQDRIRELYATADLFVLPSFAEGVPVVLMEAMAQEIACLSTGITGHPELIRDGVDGLLVPPSDVDGMYNAVCRLMDDAELRRRLGQDGRQRVLSAYHLDHNMRAMADQIQKRLEDL